MLFGGSKVESKIKPNTFFYFKRKINLQPQAKVSQPIKINEISEVNKRKIKLLIIV